MKSFKITFILLFLGFLPFSCDNCDDNYLGKYKFEISAIKSFTLNVYSYDSTSLYSSDSFTDTIIRSPNYSFNVEISFADEKIGSLKNKFNYFTSTSYALSKQQCFDVKEYSIQNKIDSIVIRSDSSFNNNPIGSNLNRYFKMYLSFQNQFQLDSTSNQIVDYLNSDFKFNASQCSSSDSLSNSRCTDINSTFQLYVHLDKKPIGVNNHKFTIYLYKNTGEILAKSNPKRIVWL